MLRLLVPSNFLGFCGTTYSGNAQHSTDSQRLDKIVFVVDLRNQNIAWRFKTNKLFWRFWISIVNLVGPFANVIFLSQNFVLTSCIASPTWFLIKKNFCQTQSTNFIQCISTNNRPGAYLKFQPKGVTVVLVGRRALCQDIFIIQKLLICTDSAVAQAL